MASPTKSGKKRRCDTSADHVVAETIDRLTDIVETAIVTKYDDPDADDDDCSAVIMSDTKGTGLGYIQYVQQSKTSGFARPLLAEPDDDVIVLETPALGSIHAGDEDDAFFGDNHDSDDNNSSHMLNANITLESGVTVKVNAGHCLLDRLLKKAIEVGTLTSKGVFLYVERGHGKPSKTEQIFERAGFKQVEHVFQEGEYLTKSISHRRDWVLRVQQKA